MKSSLVDLLLFFVIVLLALVSGEAARAANVNSSIAFETRSPAPGSSVKVAIVFKPNEGWHTYWTNPGDAGAAPRARWKAPEGFDFSEMKHPVPSLLSVDGIASFVHKGEHSLLLNMRIPQDASVGSPIPIDLNLEWLSCSNTQCVPERSSIRAVLVVGKGETDFVGLSQIRKAESQLPRTLSGASFQKDGDDWVFVIPQILSGAIIFPDDNSMFEPSSVQSLHFENGNTFIKVEAIPGSSGRKTFSGAVRTDKGNFTINGAQRKTIVIERDESSDSGVKLDPAISDNQDVSIPDVAESPSNQINPGQLAGLQGQDSDSIAKTPSDDKDKGESSILWGFLLLGAIGLGILAYRKNKA